MDVRANSAASIDGRRVPDFFIIGAPKTGTTSLHAILRRHPQIFMPELKEPLYLATDLRPRPGHEQKRRERWYPKTLDRYLSLFANAGPEQLAGEATPTYLWSRTAAENIAEMQPNARLIAILREPADFLHSLHLAFLRGGNESVLNFGKAMSLEGARRTGRRIPRGSHRPQLLQYSTHVRYVEQLRRFRDRFSPEQMLVLIYDDFRKDNDATIRTVLRFLEVDEEFQLASERLNVSPEYVRSHRARETIESLKKGRSPIVRQTRATTRALTSSAMRRSVRTGVEQLTQHRIQRARDERLVEELRRRYKPEVEALSDYLGRDLVALWGYEDVH
jgi:hypothetical protein